ncbi:unnamed protein product [Prorocentrum cordatum]|uniref:Uncharacterized protein n=1 Tax=Prorocentrum cordatum TaxID=2364126 RepID=A0ABN9V7K7_9DINO|nr:unnamed protein product [Polarella glacialis]
MPTVLGLAGVQAPSTMDGISSAGHLIADTAAAPVPTRQLLELEGSLSVGSSGWRKMQLIEYCGLGDVARYQHLEDTANNTFRALRVIDGKHNLKLVEFTDVGNWHFEKRADEYELFDLGTDP